MVLISNSRHPKVLERALKESLIFILWSLREQTIYILAHKRTPLVSYALCVKLTTVSDELLMGDFPAGKGGVRLTPIVALFHTTEILTRASLSQ